MPTSVFRNDELRRLVQEEGVQLVDVLLRDEYEEEHLPGAVNIPLMELNRETTAQLRRNVPVGKIAKRMRERGATAVLVTTSGGSLVGLLYRDDAGRPAGEQVG